MPPTPLQRRKHPTRNPPPETTQPTNNPPTLTTAIRQHFRVWDAFGVTSPDPSGPARGLATLQAAGPEGDAARRKLHDALEAKGGEGRSLGLCANQLYDIPRESSSSPSVSASPSPSPSSAIYLADEPGPRPAPPPGFDPLVDVLVSTYPGSRLPHARLDAPARRGGDGDRLASTHDLAGGGAFCLLTGRGGEAWLEAARAVAARTGIPLRAHAIGFGLAWQDIYREWYARRGVGDAGCVLVRPDRFVAWRSVDVVADCEGKLAAVLDAVLSREGATV